MTEIIKRFYFLDGRVLVTYARADLDTISPEIKKEILRTIWEEFSEIAKFKRVTAYKPLLKKSLTKSL